MEIETSHLTLREFSPEDFDAIFGYWTDPRYLRYYEPVNMESREADTRSFLANQIAQQREQPRTKFQLAATELGSTRVIGNVGIRKAHEISSDAELGCEFAPDYWNKGYATEAVSAMVEFGFVRLGLHRIWASTMLDNHGAWHVLEKLGFKREGELRETTLLAGGWANSVIYGMLDREWSARPKD